MGSVCGKKSPAPVETDKAPRQSYKEPTKESSATNSNSNNAEAAPAAEVAAPAEAEEEEAAPAEDE